METELNGWLTRQELSYLESLAIDVVEESRLSENEQVFNSPSNQTGGALIMPGGRGCYPAFWIRDFAMSLDSKVVPCSEQMHALLLVAAHQRDGDWIVPTGSLVPDGSIPDHITLDNKPIYYPGTLADPLLQGGRWGELPALDDHFYFIHMAWHVVKSCESCAVLKKGVNGVSVFERLERAFNVPPSDPETGLVYCTERSRGVSFGFYDTIIQTGKLLFCSILKYQASCQMAELAEVYLKDAARASYYAAIAKKIKRSIPRVFDTGRGLVSASTGLSGQPDVWASAFGVYVGVFDNDIESQIAMNLRRSYLDGTLAYRGHIRQVRVGDDYDESTAWEKCVGEKAMFPKNRYQNGGYWATPTGWVCYAIGQVDTNCASRLAKEYLQMLREDDYRQGSDCGSPWECIHPDNDYKQNPVYMTSVTCPLAAFRRLDAMMHENKLSVSN